MNNREDKVWYEISSKKIAEELTLSAMDITQKPEENSKSFSEYQNYLRYYLAIASGIKYGNVSYSNMYMKEREVELGNWQAFLRKLCKSESIVLSKNLLILGINDGQEIGFIKSKKRIFGVDISEEALNRGKRRYKNIDFILSDLRNLPFKKSFVETCVLLRTIHIFSEKDMNIIISNIFNSLKPKGKTIISIPGGFMSHSGKIFFGQIIDEDIIDKDKPMKDALKVASNMKENGFTQIKVLNKGIEIFIIGKK